MDIKESELESLSQADLEKLEDQVVADDAAKEAEEAAAAAKDDSVAKTTGDESVVKTSDANGSETVVTDDSTPKEKEEEDLTKHVSPPGKWVAKRQAAKDTKQAIAYAESVAAENSELKQRLEWIETQLASKGGDADLKPTDVLSPEKIAAVRLEFGDEVADMFQAVKTLHGANAVDDSSNGKGVSVNAELEEAISDNDELSYWQQHSPGLWDRATSANDEFIRDPEYLKLTFAERMYKVVEKVKADVVAEAKTTVPGEQKVDKTLPPDSLSGDLGASPTITEKSDVDRILEASPDEQVKMYNNASESVRERVDIKLGI